MCQSSLLYYYIILSVKDRLLDLTFTGVCLNWLFFFIDKIKIIMDIFFSDSQHQYIVCLMRLSNSTSHLNLGLKSESLLHLTTLQGNMHINNKSPLMLHMPPRCVLHWLSLKLWWGWKKKNLRILLTFAHFCETMGLSVHLTINLPFLFSTQVCQCKAFICMATCTTPCLPWDEVTHAGRQPSQNRKYN